MKKFETPEIEIEKLEIADVITTSDPGTPPPPPGCIMANLGGVG